MGMTPVGTQSSEEVSTIGRLPVMAAMSPRAGADVTSDIKGAMVFIIASRMVPESGCTLPDTDSGRACSELGCVERHRNGTQVVT